MTDMESMESMERGRRRLGRVVYTEYDMDSRRPYDLYTNIDDANVSSDEWVKLGLCKVLPTVLTSPMYCTPFMRNSIGHILSISYIELRISSRYYLQIHIEGADSVFAESDLQMLDLQDLLEL